MKLWCQLPVKMDLGFAEASVFRNIAMKGYERIERVMKGSVLIGFWTFP